ncbi:MAG: hypothetical protein JSW28_05890 [Thermoplasmata archaeon]|nr:MAG: hypothetical protein JSW28_05890 [Thermoplasmata archaeon]
MKEGLYQWGVAELTDKWVILHRHGLPKWAIFYKTKGQTVVVPCHTMKPQVKNVKVKKKVSKKGNA